MIIKGDSSRCATVIDSGECNLLMVGLNGITIKDLAMQLPGINIGIHVKDGDKWVPVRLSDLIGEER